MSDKNIRFLKQHLYLGFSDYAGPLLSLATYVAHYVHGVGQTYSK